MWTRKHLKNGAKATLHTCFASSILSCLIFFFFHAITILYFAQFLTLSVYKLDDGRYWVGYNFFIPITQLPLTLLFLLVGIFLINPLHIGQMHHFLSSRIKFSYLKSLGFAFQKGYYGNVCKVKFLTGLSVFLHSLLFVIPGIYKAYQYRMVPYLLAENPKMDYHRAVYLSMSMMKGEKWKAFVLDLSFLGWNLLSLLTCTILGIVYVTPYRNHTNAGLYIMLREKVIDNKLVNPSELYAVF